MFIVFTRGMNVNHKQEGNLLATKKFGNLKVVSSKSNFSNVPNSPSFE